MTPRPRADRVVEARVHRYLDHLDDASYLRATIGRDERRAHRSAAAALAGRRLRQRGHIQRV